MRILRVVSDLYPAVVGGIGIHAHEMSRIQSERGNEVMVITFFNKNTHYSSNSTYPVLQLPVSFKILGNSFSFRLPFTLRKLQNKYDIIHAHSHLFYSTVVCAFLRHFSSTPLIITNHGLFSQTVPLWFQKIYIKTIGKWTLNSADKIICYTTVEKEQLVKNGIVEGKIAVIHNGISSAEFIPSLNEPGKQILWIGRITPGKGVGILLEAFKILHPAHSDYTLFMIGNGPLKNKIIDKIKKMGLTDAIQLRDSIPNQDLPQIYQNSAFFVLPSFEEGVPRTILEAMSCGIPVICTDLPQLREIVEGCGIMVPTRDPQALAAAMHAMISNRAFARECGSTGRERIVTGYSWEDTVEITLSLYEEIIRKRRNGNLINENYDCEKS